VNSNLSFEAEHSLTFSASNYFQYRVDCIVLVCYRTW